MQTLSFKNFNIIPINANDAWPLCNFMSANEDRLKRYFPKTLQENLTPSLAKSFTDKKVKQFQLKEEFLFTIKEKQSNDVAGLIYIKDLNWTTKQAEFAYCISYQFESKGITTKSVALLSDYAFETLGLKTLQIIVHKDNLASVAVAMNNSFTWIKTLKNEHTPPNESPLDMELYELYYEME
ncbi:GNAT family N-acetyltransferase [Algibacter sp. L4_22]|uniref:GNAT family N-acetyltransferase n=1 Tax=Algibacter sp. L4_22 TaxID=2942477 RepID=UPI00201B6277|nr:GNAT family N-acetyltransferase [Algibacter sp. L4_22]MCL5126807.1 GNAT family N-acetyltransferase [Algibacter sp. L4_22]